MTSRYAHDDTLEDGTTSGVLTKYFISSTLPLRRTFLVQFYSSSYNISSLFNRNFIMATDIATRELRKPIDVAEYLFRRLHEVGIRSVHGVPGKRPSPIGSPHSEIWR
jgi:hypothetical protein